MFVVAPSASTSIADVHPLAPFWHQVGGFLRDLFSLQFAVYRVATEPEQLAPVLVLPASPGRVTLDVTSPSGVDRLGIGRYAARFTVGAGWTPGRYILRWWWRSTSTSAEVTVDAPFDVMVGAPSAPIMMTSPLYALPSDMRAEGVTTTHATNVRLYQALAYASRQIETYTRRRFAPSYESLTFDGNGSVAVLLDMPVIALSELLFASITLFLSELPLDATAYRVYNRHLIGLFEPDDRLNPKLEIYGLESYVATYALNGARFPRGKQNVNVKGVFGYTDPDGSPFGCTPWPITHVTKLLALRMLRKLTDPRRADVFAAPFVTDEKTRDQSISFARSGGMGAVPGSAVGMWTGDPEIDQIIVQYMRGPALGSA